MNLYSSQKNGGDSTVHLGCVCMGTIFVEMKRLRTAQMNVDNTILLLSFTFYMRILGTRWIIDHHSAIGLERICPRRILRSIYDDSKYSIICKAGR